MLIYNQCISEGKLLGKQGHVQASDYSLPLWEGKLSRGTERDLEVDFRSLPC